MSNTAKISLKADLLCVESSDLLKKAKDTRSSKMIQVQPFHIRTTMDLTSMKLSIEKKTAVIKVAIKEADRFEDEQLKKISGLVLDLERLSEEDKRGNDKAGSTAQSKTKEVSDDLDEALTEFGTRIRKAVEKGVAIKLTSGVKSSSTGSFKGIKLIAKFEHGGASAEVLKGYQDAAKSLDQAGDQAVTKSKEVKKATDALKQSFRDQFDSVAKINAKGDAAEQATMVNGIPQSARALGKEVDLGSDRLDGFKEMLAKTSKALDAEAKELSKDLATPEFRAKKDKFDRVRKELLALQKVVDKRLVDSKLVSQKLKTAEKIVKPKDWQVGLTAINDMVERFDAIDADTFNKAADQMVMEGKKKA